MNAHPEARFEPRDRERRRGAASVMERMAAASPRFTARIAGVFYLLTILLGGAVLFVPSRLGFALNLIAGACYLAVTVLFYALFKPVNRSLALLVVFFNLAGLTIGTLNWQPGGVNLEFGCFGCYCLLIGYLIVRSTFLPRMLGVLMALAGLGYLTILSPLLANALSPYNLALGILGEGSLTLWLLAMGVNAERWKEQASATGRPSAEVHRRLHQSRAT